MIKRLLTYILVCFSLWGYSQQDSTLLYVYSDPSGNYRVKINNDLLPVSHVFRVLPGKYKVQIWSPHYIVKDTSIIVRNEPCTLRTKLTKTQELITYESLNFQYNLYNKRSLFLGTSSFIGLTAAAIGIAYNSRINLNKIKAENGYNYQVDGYSYENLKTSKRNAVFDYAVIYSGSAICLGSAYLLYRTIKKRKGLEKPVLKEDNHFIVEDIGMNIGKTKGLSLTIGF